MGLSVALALAGIGVAVQANTSEDSATPQSGVAQGSAEEPKISDFNIQSLDVHDMTCHKRDDSGWSYWCRYPVVTLDEVSAMVRPQLDDAVRAINDKNAANMGRWMQTSKETMISDLAESPDIPLYHTFYIYNSDLRCSRADNRLLSLVQIDYQYLGGVHGVNLFNAHNFDVVKGKRLKMTDVIGDVPAFSNAVINALERTNKPETFNEDWRQSVAEILSNPKSAESHWRLTPSGVGVMFNPYELACYAAGTFCVNIDYLTNPTLFKAPYRENYFAATPSKLSDAEENWPLLYDMAYGANRGEWKLTECMTSKGYVPAKKLGLSGALTIDDNNMVSFKLSGSGDEVVNGDMILGREILGPSSPFKGGDFGWTFCPHNAEHAYHAFLNPAGDLEVVFLRYTKGVVNPKVVRLKFVHQ